MASLTIGFFNNKLYFGVRANEIPQKLRTRAKKVLEKSKIILEETCENSEAKNLHEEKTHAFTIIASHSREITQLK